MADVRTFKATSMQEALTLVREEMGSDAVILQTRQIPGRKNLLPWSKSKEEFEITAGLGINVRTPDAINNKKQSSGIRHRASNLQPAKGYAESTSQPATPTHSAAPVREQAVARAGCPSSTAASTAPI